MSIGIVIVAHEPMASALYACGCHVLHEQHGVLTYDVAADDDPAVSQAAVTRLIGQVDTGAGVLVLTDLFGATPSNVATQAVLDARAHGHDVALLAGANTPMLLRALTYRELTLDEVARRAMAGARDAVLLVDGNS